MANTNSKKPALHGAAAASHSKAETTKNQAKLSNANSTDTGPAVLVAGNKATAVRNPADAASLGPNGRNKTALPLSKG